MNVIYMSHPLGGGADREQNRANASKWVAWIALTYDVAVIADWIILSGHWDESPASRARGIEIDMALIARCDEVWLVGGRVSAGMKQEANEAHRLGKVVVDMTWLGALPPVEEVT